MKYISIMPRRHGKSTIVQYEFLKDPENSIIIVPELKFSAHYELNKKYRAKIFSQKQDFRGFSFKNVIIDQYFLMDIKSRIKFYFLSLNDIENFYIFGTPEKMYSEILFNFIKDLKSKNRTLNHKSVESFLSKNKYKYSNEDMEDLYWNFITDPDSKVVLNLACHVKVEI